MKMRLEWKNEISKIFQSIKQFQLEYKMKQDKAKIWQRKWTGL